VDLSSSYLLTAYLSSILILLAFHSSKISFLHYDVVVNGGRVMDPETDFDEVRNVGISDGKIAIITEKSIFGKETIEAKGLVVCPGFIEGHVHSTDPVSVH
jgi:N-acyl-D-aspartate/D-glutamate deacylase